MKNFNRYSKKILLIILAISMVFTLGSRHRIIASENTPVMLQGQVEESIWDNTPFILKENGKEWLKLNVKVAEEKTYIGFIFDVASETKTLELAISTTNPLSINGKKIVINTKKEVQTYQTISSSHAYVFIPSQDDYQIKFEKEGNQLYGEIVISNNILNGDKVINELYVLPMIKDSQNKDFLIAPTLSDELNVSSYLRFNAYGYSKAKVVQGKDLIIDGNLDDWKNIKNSISIVDQRLNGKQVTYKAFIGTDGLYISADIKHRQLSLGKDDIKKTTYLEIQVFDKIYRLTHYQSHQDLHSKMISLEEDGYINTFVEIFVPNKVSSQFTRLGLGFYSPEEDFIAEGSLSHSKPSKLWFENRHHPSDPMQHYFVYTDGIYKTTKNNGIQTGTYLGSSALGHTTTSGFNLSLDRGFNPSVRQVFASEQQVYFNQLLGDNYLISSSFDAIKSYGEDKSRVGLIVAENDDLLITYMVDYKTQIHSRVMVKNKILQTWSDILINVQLDIKQNNMNIAAYRNKDEITFYINGISTFSKKFENLNKPSVAGLMTMGYEANFYNYHYTTDLKSISNYKSLASEKRGKTMMTIGDSIFDFTDNRIADMLQNIARETGYKHLFIDNIGATTIAPLKERGIVDHVDQGLYESFPVPDILVIQRGTNDAAFVYNGTVVLGEVGNGDKNTTFGAIEYIMSYFRQKYPNTRIIWSNSIYRKNLPAETHQALHDALLAIAPNYNVEVFDIRSAIGINQENYTSYLYDGVHLNDDGKVLMQDAFINYINQTD